MRPSYRFILLSPDSQHSVGRTRGNERQHRSYLRDLQRLRGSVYLKDGAIHECELEEDGRFHMRGDEQSWHLLLVDGENDVIGCARYLVHPNTVAFRDLRISHSALAKDPVWGARMRSAVEADLAIAREKGFAYVEIGGWALAEAWRGSRAALEILVGSYALAHFWGGAIGACTATVRHGSSSMLRRLGGTGLKCNGEELPSYEDAQYDCQMELLRFDCRTVAPRFAPLVSQLRNKLAEVQTITPEPARDWFALPREVGAVHLGTLAMSPLAY